MKPKLLIILILPALFVFVSAAHTSAAVISFNILDTYIETGENFDVEVYVQEDSGVGDLTAFGFDVDPFNSLSLFSYNGYSVGPDFEDNGYNSNPIFLPVNYVAGLNWFNPNAGVNVLVATLSFTAGTAAGTDNLSILGLYDGFDHGLYYEDFFYEASIDASTEITINSSQPVPEPASLWLLGIGMVGMARLRWKNK